MNILIVEDDNLLRNYLKSEIGKNKTYKVFIAERGFDAFKIIKYKKIDLVILDWELPDIDGIKLIRYLRNLERDSYLYIIMLTSRRDEKDLTFALKEGADDYISKPFGLEELFSRIDVGKRMVLLHKSLKEKIEELEKSLKEVKVLKGLLPICSYCKSVRVDDKYWEKLENYLSSNTQLKLTHGVCPECQKEYLDPKIVLAKRKKIDKIN
jgi:DNA-binding response OmpR family regulator